jgi:DNA-binding response OmpR family regulator
MGSQRKRLDGVTTPLLTSRKIRPDLSQGSRFPLYAERRPIKECLMPRILVVDDEADVRAMISIVLRIHHFEIVEAASAAAALEAFEDSSFDVAIVDIFLDGANGFDLITRMRERVSDLAVVAMSGMATLDFVPQWPELADVACLQKPFRPNELMRAIEAARRADRQPVAGDRVGEGAA